MTLYREGALPPQVLRTHFPLEASRCARHACPCLFRHRAPESPQGYYCCPVTGTVVSIIRASIYYLVGDVLSILHVLTLLIFTRTCARVWDNMTPIFRRHREISNLPRFVTAWGSHRRLPGSGPVPLPVCRAPPQRRALLFACRFESAFRAATPQFGLDLSGGRSTPQVCSPPSK